MSETKDHFDGTGILISVCWEMQGMANAFRITGNNQHADWLEGMVADIETAKELVDRSFDEQLKHGLDFSREMSGTLLKAVLDGALKTCN